MVATRGKLALADIADLRAYEREREAFRDHVIALKKKRRVSVCLLYTSPSPRDGLLSRMPSSA